MGRGGRARRRRSDHLFVRYRGGSRTVCRGPASSDRSPREIKKASSSWPFFIWAPRLTRNGQARSFCETAISHHAAPYRRASVSTHEFASQDPQPPSPLPASTPNGRSRTASCTRQSFCTELPPVPRFARGFGDVDAEVVCVRQARFGWGLGEEALDPIKHRRLPCA